jgi:hypothetical protein
MPRGSKPGERRGGRETGTPNKKTLLRNAFIDAVAADPNLLPLDFFLRLMHQSTLTLDRRVRAAEAALPFMHARPRPTKKPQTPLPQDGDAQPRVKLRRKTDANPSDLDEFHLGHEFQDGGDECEDTDGVALQPGSIEPSEGAGESDLGGPSMRHARVEPEGGEAQGAGMKAVTPLAFLRAVMRHPDTPVPLRMKVASIIAPYLHAKATPPEESEADYVVDDQYGFSVEPAQAKNLRDALEGKGSYPQPRI